LVMSAAASPRTVCLREAGSRAVRGDRPSRARCRRRGGDARANRLQGINCAGGMLSYSSS
jgi:hypothetical protein